MQLPDEILGRGWSALRLPVQIEDLMVELESRLEREELRLLARLKFEKGEWAGPADLFRFNT